MNKALIIKIVSKEYTLLIDGKTRVKAICAGKMRKNVYPVVGDEVIYEYSLDTYVIKEICERRNYMIRPNLANIDQAIIMMSTFDPDFSYELVNRMIFLIEYANIRPIVCISKSDLTTTEKIDEISAYYSKMNYQVISSVKDQDLSFLKDVLKDKVTVLCGQSGVGKSTLLNTINPELELKTDEISKALGRGKHTTRHVELFELYGGFIADTPGFSSLDLSHIDKELLANHISAFQPYLGKCRFNNCMHMNEPECALKEAVEQGYIERGFYNTYLDIINFIISGNFKANRHRTLK